jgi:hypothetical protein
LKYSVNWPMIIIKWQKKNWLRKIDCCKKNPALREAGFFLCAGRNDFFLQHCLFDGSSSGERSPDLIRWAAI